MPVGLVRLAVCMGGRGNRSTRTKAAITEPKSAPNGAAWPCACQLPVNACLQRSRVQGPRVRCPSMPNQGGKTVHGVLGEGRLALGEKTARKGKDNYV